MFFLDPLTQFRKIGAATSSAAMPQLAKLIDNTNLLLPIRQAMAQAAAAALGWLAGGASGLAAGIHVEANNRELHKSESDKLSELKKGKSPEEQQRLNSAACALVRCSDGVPPSDPYYGLLKGMQEKGAAYKNEMMTARVSIQTKSFSTKNPYGSFEYPRIKGKP